MVLIEWDDDFAVGSPALDKDHRDLIADINGLYEQLGSGEHDLTVIDFIDAVHDHAREHFVREEAVMLENDYPEYEDHKAEHERFLERLSELQDEYQDEEGNEDGGMSLWLSHWLINHFRVYDARLQPASEENKQES